ncbi:hypothetical protein QN354_02180 [Cryobacterium sp. 5I3]|uniref:hypothetical protein n=1 Tax=Cryobacterium sp. 5I3 TaxID=3048592 RepID=UPI002B227BB5|nr:hypothetical protein [Cryobacterium sp. 5I3]MEB0200562.1 hypothetical protein [Cryobacterium sp. 5I3]
MQTAPSGFATALAARTPLSVDTTVTAGGSTVLPTNSTGFAKTITVRRSLAGELPASATNVTGGQSATVKITGDGAGTDAPSPFDATDQGAWLAAPLALSAGYAGLTVPVFSGTVSELRSAESTRTVIVDGRDAAGELTAAVRLQPYGAQARRGQLGAATAHSTNTQGVITNILHSNGIRVTPAPRSFCVLSVPGVGGWLADIGWVVPTAGSTPTTWLEAGRFGSAPKETGEYFAGFPSTDCKFSNGSIHQVEFWYRHTGADRNEVVLVQMSLGGTVWLDITSNTARLYVRRTGGYAALSLALSGTLSVGWHHIAFEFDFGTDAKLWIDGVYTWHNSGSWGSDRPYPSTITALRFWAGRIQGLNYCSGTTLDPPTTAVMDFTAQADLSRGALDLGTIPNVDGKDSWAVLQDIAAAELGMVGFSESGRFFFKNRADLTASTAPVATWGLDLVEELGGSVSVDGILTRATATVKQSTGVYAGYSNADPLTMAVPSAIADRVFAIPISGSSVLLTGSVPFVPTSNQVSIVTLASGAWNTEVGMVLCFDSAGSSIYTGPDVRAWITPVSQTAWRVNFWNNSGAILYTAWPASWVTGSDAPFERNAGSPAFWVCGYSFPTDQIPDTPVDRTNYVAVDTWGERVLDLGDSVWRQNVAQVEAFATAVLASTSRPRAQLDDITVPADPRWQLGDPITVHDALGRLADFTARITSIELTISLEVEGGMVGKYGLRQV